MKSPPSYILPAFFRLDVQTAYAADFLDCFFFPAFLRGLIFGATFFTHFSRILGIILGKKNAQISRKLVCPVGNSLKYLVFIAKNGLHSNKLIVLLIVINYYICLLINTNRLDDGLGI